MRGFVTTIKCFVFLYNLACLLFGIAFISFSADGLKMAKTGSDEHAYFIVGVILGSIVCMTTLFGFYGVVGQLIGVNFVCVCFMLILMTVQYLQISTFQSHNFEHNAWQQVQGAWQNLPTQPKFMASIEKTYQCCAIENSRDYNYLSLGVPSSCYHQQDQQPELLFVMGCREALQRTYKQAIIRVKFFNWALIGAEFLTFATTIALNVIFLHQRRMGRGSDAYPVRGYVERCANHVGSRSSLIA